MASALCNFTKTRDPLDICKHGKALCQTWKAKLLMPICCPPIAPGAYCLGSLLIQVMEVV